MELWVTLFDRRKESGSFAFPCAVNRVIHDSIACYSKALFAPTA